MLFKDLDVPWHAGPEKGLGAWNQNSLSMFKNLNTQSIETWAILTDSVQLITAILKHKFDFEFDLRTIPD